MITVKIIATPEAITRMRSRAGDILNTMIGKMNQLMIELQSRVITQAIPKFFPDGAPKIAGTVAVQPAHLDGTRIVGTVTAGGPRTTTETKGGPNAGKIVDYAAIQEAGVPHSWMIQPVLYSSAWAITQKKRAMIGIGGIGGGMPRALAFQVGGKTVFARRVEHGPLPERPFMREPLAQMGPEIIAGLQAAFRAAVGGE